MTALIVSSVLRTCFGDGAQTYDALMAGRCGIGPLRRGDPTRLRVAHRAGRLPGTGGVMEY